MKNKLSAVLFAAAALLGCAGCGSAESGSAGEPDQRVFGFYYNWYGNTEVNGKEVHWGHGVIREQQLRRSCRLHSRRG